MNTETTSSFAERVQQILDAQIVRTAPLRGGCIGNVLKATLDDDRKVVIKTMDRPACGEGDLEIEGWMLQYLRENSDLPVPEVFHSSPDLLVMQFLPGDSRFSSRAEENAAELLAALHAVGSAPLATGKEKPPHGRRVLFGLERDTLIGGLRQSNTQTKSWLEFFAEQRIMDMARKAHQEGKVSLSLLHRLENFCNQLDKWLEEPPHPSLLHGDAWTTNILASGNRITGFVDPAVYYGHPEIELAFTTLFGTFGEPFFKRYNQLRPIPEGFFELRRDLYNLYPLLVHVRLFGTEYLSGIERTLKRIGC